MTSPTRLFFKPVDAEGTSPNKTRLSLEIAPFNGDIGTMTIRGRNMRAVYQISGKTSQLGTPFDSEKVTLFFSKTQDSAPLFSLDIEIQGNWKVSVAQAASGKYTATAEKIVQVASPVFQPQKVYPELDRPLDTQ